MNRHRWRIRFPKSKSKKKAEKSESPLSSRISDRDERVAETEVGSHSSLEAVEGLKDLERSTKDSAWWLFDPDETERTSPVSDWGRQRNTPDGDSWSAPSSSPRYLRKFPFSYPLVPPSSLPLIMNSPELQRRCNSCRSLRRDTFPTVVERSSAAMFDFPSPARGDRIAEFPDSPPACRRPSSPNSSALIRRRDRRLRSSVGSSDLTKAQLAFRDSEDQQDQTDDREHFTVDTIMVNHKETSHSQQQLNQYIVGEMIGKGSYGTVLRCTNVFDKKDYALKVISKQHLRRASVSRKLAGGGRATLQAVKHEIAILKKVNHRNIVKLLEVIDGEDEDEMYLVFELVENGHVLEVNGSEIISEERAWDYFIDILLGVEYLHSLNIAHRDIKPSNLLLDREDRVKIADFGVSKMFEDSQPAILSKTAGSPAFMAPETMRDESSNTILYGAKPADIWSVGVTLYCLVFGFCPFWPSRSGDISDLQDRILHQELRFPDHPQISSDLRDLLIRLLEKEPTTRATIPEIRAHPWILSRIGQHSQCLDHNNVASTTVTEEEITAAYGHGQKTCISVSQSQELLCRNVTNLPTEDSGLGSSREVSPAAHSTRMALSPVVELKKFAGGQEFDSAFVSQE